jgi:glycosyltransferase involved in cell wall biosynthesis
VASHPRTLVVIPAFNEEDALPLVLDELLRVAPEVDVVVIDDGSTDKTIEVARAAGVTVVPLPFNLGIGGALRCGFRYAVEQGYSRAVQFDADGQHDAREIARLLEGLDQGADMVIGSRFADASHDYEVSRARAGAMSLLRVVVRQLSGHQFTDTSTGFRAFSQPVIHLFAEEYPAEYMESVEALVLALAAGFRVAEVPVHMNSRSAGLPSNRRLRLVYHYLRLLLVITVSAGRRPATTRRPE